MDLPKIEMPVGERAGVLIVDDTPAKLVALAAIVSGMELEIVTATSGEQALRQLLKRDFALILLDVNMPTMDGFETATLIRSRPRSEHTPIIFVTAEANSEVERISGYTLGAVDFIYSPILPEILRAKVRVFASLFYLQRQVLLHNERLESLVAQRTAALTSEREALRESENRFRKQSQRLYELIWATDIGTWEWNVQTGETVFNERWAEIVGYTLDELAPISINTWSKLVHPDDGKRSGELLTQCFNRESDAYLCEARMRHKNGEWVWVLDRGRVVEWMEDGKPLRMSGTHQEITERKQAQDEIQRVSDLLRDSNANLNLEMAERRSLEINLIRISEEQRRVIGRELHDGLGQHLTSLSLLSASLQQQLTNRAQPEAKAAQRIGQLINEATTMTRSVVRGLYPISLEHGDLSAALEQLTDHARSLHKMDYVLGIGPEVQVHDPLVAINLYRITQEAINNALKYSQAGLMRIDLARVDGKVRLTLSDDGIGIDPSSLGSAKGLGMHSMHYRASLLGGSMAIESNAQQGTTITVTYPDLEGQSEQRQRA